ncbi:MAG: bifunctional alpha,alpha-trehalose-phosphate synthase (UDP-forming)/trehalose-phosphatase [Vicinamibacterales bacterium]
MAANRLLIVSNRLPVVVDAAAGELRLEMATGGLASGLRPHHERTEGLWIGWPGDVSRLAAQQRAMLEQQLRARAIVPVHLSTEHIERYYHGFANRVLWPLFHYLIDRVPIDAAGWGAYRQVNQAFAEVVAREYRPGDTIWIHDYQLMLLPQLLRRRLPSARIGFFLHIPFPSSEVFRILPWRREILNGMLGADLIGFHTFAYLRHFLASLLHVDGLEADIDRVRFEQRDVRFGVFPIGVDAALWAERARSPAVLEAAAHVREEAGGRQIILGVDRLDYTKGIPRRLYAVQRLLERHPELRDRVRYVQVAVPSRGGVDSYQRFKRQVEETVGRINGECGTLSSSPVHYIHRSVTPTELAALYCAAEVMLVTPLRDGMNLVAKEFVATRVDDDGVLLLSEFAGAAAELDAALTVNPYDIEVVAATLQRALSMPRDERRNRMQRLRTRVVGHDVHAWVAGFLERLERRPAREEPELGASLPLLLGEIRRAKRLYLLLDYDGTLVPLAQTPELATPDESLMSLLEELTGLEGIRVEIVSGRPRETLEEWFGQLPLALSADHGFWQRRSPEHPWQAAADVPADALHRIARILEQFVLDTPGALMEQKTASIAWHYRRADREFGARQAHELRMLLGDALSNQPFEVIEGKKVIEVRLRGISKALVAHRIRPDLGPDDAVVAVGDDQTDEDLFRALPPSSVTIAVGNRPTAARFRVDDVGAVRQFLRSLVEQRRTIVADTTAP